MNDNKAWNSRNYNYWNQQPNVTSNNSNQMSYVAAASQQTNSQNMMGGNYDLGSVVQDTLLQHQQQAFHRMNANVPSYVPNNMGMGASSNASGNMSGSGNGGSLSLNHNYSCHNSTCSSQSSVEGLTDANISSVNSARSSNSLGYNNRSSFGSSSGTPGTKFIQRSTSEGSIGPYSFEGNMFSPSQVSAGYFSNYEYTPRADTAVSNLTLIPPDSTATTNTSNTGYGKMSNMGSEGGHRHSQDKSSHPNALNEVDKLKMELALKNQMINNLSEKLNQAKKSSSTTGTSSVPANQHSSSTANGQQDLSALGPITIPAEYSTLFKELSQQLRESKKELEDTKLKLELLVVGLAMSPQKASMTVSGQYDEQEIAHRIVSKLQILTDENESLIKMMNFGSKSSLLVELGLLRHENKMLKEKIAANSAK